MQPEKQYLPIFRPVKIFDEVESTYSLLETMLEREPSLPSGTFIDTEFQRSGRGQRGNRWHSSRGKNLLPSFLLKDSGLKASDTVKISDWVALSVAEVVSFFAEGLSAKEFWQDYEGHSKIKVKWPNDVYYENRKISGILITHHISGSFIASSVCGLGLNINELDFPQELPNPISLRQIIGKDLPLSSVREKLVCCLTENYPLLFTPRGERDLHCHYESKLYLRGIPVPFFDILRQERLLGSIEGVDPDGRLRLRILQNDELRRYAFKEIRYECDSTLSNPRDL